MAHWPLRGHLSNHPRSVGYDRIIIGGKLWQNFILLTCMLVLEFGSAARCLG